MMRMLEERIIIGMITSQSVIKMASEKLLQVFLVFTNWGHDEPKASTDAQGFVELFPDGTWGISNSTSGKVEN
mgnify:CR=1 FL=1